MCDFLRFWDGNFFRMPNLACYYAGPPKSEKFIIFARDHFKYSLFSQNMLPVQFHAILRRQPLSRAQLRTLISRLSRELSFYHFPTQPHWIFVIWHKCDTRAISRDSVTATFFARPIVHTNISALQGALLLQFSHATASNIRYFA